MYTLSHFLAEVIYIPGFKINFIECCIDDF